MAYSWSLDLLSKVTLVDSVAASQREDNKVKIYSVESLPGGFSVSVVSLVFEHFGCWRGKALKFLDDLSNLS